ncbi:MAG: ABC transporter substrate-binding protein [Alphaproteobacteria bacterium]|nr:ABC transporter substrate-binding protein [Alphaproteobacteria bacterium]
MRRLRRAARLALALMLVAWPALAKPARVVSTNLCADQLALWLAEPDRLLSVSYLSADAELSYFADRVGLRPLNRGLSEEVMAFKPDLVLAGEFQARASSRWLRRQGIAVIELGIADSLAVALSQLRQVGQALGERARAEAAALELAAIAALPETTADAPRALVLRPNGYSAGAGSLGDELLRRAGLANAARELRLPAFALLSLEQIALLSPALIVLDRQELRGGSLAERLLRHRALRLTPGETAALALPSRLWICPSPGLGEAVERLAAAARAIANGPILR